jgi:hypothetical protein
VTGDYSVYSRKGGVDLYFHTFVLWASDWGWIKQTLNSRWSPPETEVFLSLSSSALVGGKGGAGPSLLHTTLEAPTEYINARWM